jgi:hypothetical protein
MRLLRQAAVFAALTVALVGGAYGMLAAGMKRATPQDRLAADALKVLDATRGSGAVIDVDGRRLVASCKALRVGSSIVDLDDGTRLLVARTRVARLRPVASARELLAPDPPDLVAAEANLAGSHDFYSRALTATLFGGRVIVRPTRFADRLAYALRLGDGRPLVELIVDRGSLRPLGARYVSRTSSGTSRLFTEPSLRRYRPTGC